jgi:SAM-dependent methyltransferase
VGSDKRSLFVALGFGYPIHMSTPSETRTASYGESWKPTPVDRFGVWLSARKLRHAFLPIAGSRLLDLGAGYHATLSRGFAGEAASVTVVDLSLSDELKSDARFTCVEGRLPEAMVDLPTDGFDRVLFNNVLEHLVDREHALSEVHRVLAPGGVAFVNVPSWWGKMALETAAFRLGVAPAEEMDDHKIYFDPRDLWPTLVAAGFKPSRITCRRHKFGLNTFAICRK